MVDHVQQEVAVEKKTWGVFFKGLPDLPHHAPYFPYME